MQFNRDRSRSDEQPTWELPWLARVEVDLDERPLGDALVGHLLEEVVAHQLLVAGVEPEPRRERQLDVPQAHASSWPIPSMDRSLLPSYVCIYLEIFSPANLSISLAL